MMQIVKHAKDPSSVITRSNEGTNMAIITKTMGIRIRMATLRIPRVKPDIPVKLEELEIARRSSPQKISIVLMIGRELVEHCYYQDQLN